jgi:hypothetical protein
MLVYGELGNDQQRARLLKESACSTYFHCISGLLGVI